MPFVTMIAGPNGSGKSTLIARLREDGIDLGEYLNADDIARDLVKAIDPDHARVSDAISRQAQVAVRERRDRALAERRDHSFETVMSHPSHIDYLRKARAAGFTIIVYFVATDDPAINSGRVANRVLQGGHDVPVDRITARYYRCLANLPAAIAVADDGAILDNGSRITPLRALAGIRDGTTFALPTALPSPRWWLDVQEAIRHSS